MADPGSFDDAVSGCDYVMHVASVVSVKIPRARVREEQIDPSIHGVENILSAIEKTSSVKAFILTSSLSAVYGDCWERGPDHTFTEDDWNATATETFFPYALSKTLSERRAWDLYEQIKTNRVAQEESTHEDATPEDENLMKTMPRWRMVAILPAFVVGPPAVPGIWPPPPPLYGFILFCILEKKWYYSPPPKKRRHKNKRLVYFLTSCFVGR